MLVSDNTTYLASNAVEELSLTATQLAIQNFEWHYVTLVFFNATLWSGVDAFLQSYRKSTIVGKGTFYPKFADQLRQYVLFGNNLDDIEHMLKWMCRHGFDNTGKFIIVCQSQDLDKCDESRAVRTLWDHKVTNVVFLKHNEKEVAGYTYDPLNDSDCRVDVPVKFDNLNMCFNGSHQRNCKQLFARKFGNFNKCHLVASSFIQAHYMKIIDGVPSGANGDLLVLLAEKLNATLKTITPRIGHGWGKQEEDGSWSGSLADVYYDHANLSMTSAATTRARYSYFQMSIDYSTAGVIWVTHPPKKIPSSLKLTYPFQLNAQLAVSMCFMLVVLCALIRRSKFWHFHGRVIEGNTSRTGIVFYAWMILMGLPSTRLPTKPAFLSMVYLWMWFCVFLRTFYQVSLISVLKANYYFTQFDTIDDAIDANYPFGGFAALKDYYIDYPNVYDNWTYLDFVDIIPTMRKVSEGMEFVLAMSQETADTIIFEEKINVHILKQKVVTFPTVIFFKKFSPIAISVNKVLVELVESGFSDKLKQKYTKTVKAKKAENALEPINMEHFTGCYLLLISGWTISLLFFVGEIFYDKILAQLHKTKLLLKIK